MTRPLGGGIVGQPPSLASSTHLWGRSRVGLAARSGIRARRGAAGDVASCGVLGRYTDQIVTKDEFIKELAGVLMVEPDELRPDVDLTKFEAWDSTAVLNLVVLLDDSPPDGLRPLMRDVVDACPTGAVRVEST